MRVLFNVEALLAPPLTGVGHYARHLLDGLLDPAHGIDVTLVARGRAAHLPNPNPDPNPVTVQAIEAGPVQQRRLRRAIGMVPGARAAYAALQDVREWATRPRIPADLYHDPNHLLRPMGCKGVVTIHDLSVLRYPQFHPPERVRAMGGAMKRAAAKADRIIADSHYIARDITATLGVPPDRIRVVPLGVGAEFRPLGEDAAPILATYGLAQGGYVLAVGTREPRKNLERLLEAFLALPDATRSARPLILVGPPGWRAARIEQRLDEAERQGQVRRLGYVPDAHRPALYSGSACFAYPSLYEGFGLPPLEAAACGTPVLTSRDSPMEEVLGDLAVLVDPLDTADITAALGRLLADPAHAARALAAALALADRYSWPACVAGTVAAYRGVVG